MFIHDESVWGDLRYDGGCAGRLDDGGMRDVSGLTTVQLGLSRDSSILKYEPRLCWTEMATTTAFFE